MALLPEYGVTPVLGVDLTHCADQYDKDQSYMRADVADYRQLRRAFEEFEPDLVYHLAAEFGRHNGEGWFEDLWRTNQIGTRNVLELCHEFESRLIFTSTSEVYGSIVERPLKEWMTNVRDMHHHNEYALSKWTNEKQIEQFGRRHPTLDWTIVRLFNVYGTGEHPTDYRNCIALFADHLLKGEDIEVWDAERTFMDISDLTPTLITAGREFRDREIVNIGGVETRQIMEIAEMVRHEVGADEALVRYRNRPEPNNAPVKVPDITKARSFWGHDPQVSIEDGLPRYVQWLRKHWRYG